MNIQSPLIPMAQVTPASPRPSPAEQGHEIARPVAKPEQSEAATNQNPQQEAVKERREQDRKPADSSHSAYTESSSREANQDKDADSRPTRTASEGKLLDVFV